MVVMCVVVLLDVWCRLWCDGLELCWVCGTVRCVLCYIATKCFV